MAASLTTAIANLSTSDDEFIGIEVPTAGFADNPFVRSTTWPQNSTHVLALNPQSTDHLYKTLCTLEVKEKDTLIRVPVYKELLESYSPVFKDLLSNLPANAKDHVTHIDNCDEQTILAFRQWLYIDVRNKAFKPTGAVHIHPYLLIKLWLFGDRFKIRYLQVMVLQMLQEQLEKSPRSLTQERLSFVFKRTSYGSALRSWHIDAFAAGYSLTYTPGNHFRGWDYDGLRELITVLSLQSLPNGIVLQENRRRWPCSYHVHTENEGLPISQTPRGTRFSPFRTDTRPFLPEGIVNYGLWYWTYKDPEARAQVELSAYHTITAQPEYGKKSLEELRLEDYELGLLGPLSTREQWHACNGMLLVDEASGVV